MSEHTPTPWTIAEVKTSCGRCFKIGSDEMLNGEGKPTYVCVYDDYGCGDNPQQANANFIVKAVNNHAALVKSLDACRRALKNRDRTEKEEDVYALALRTLDNATHNME